MPRIEFLRHGESTAQASHRPNDMYDAPLTEQGRSQAAGVTGHYDVVLCSPLARARQTLEHSNITYSQLEIIQEG